MVDTAILIIGLVVEITSILSLGQLYVVNMKLQSMKDQEKRYWETWRKAKEAERND